MPSYKYKGLNSQTGKDSEGEMFAVDEEDLKARLIAHGILLTEIKKQGEKRKSNFWAVSSKVSPLEFTTFCQQFAIMIKSGVSIKDSLGALSNQRFSTVFHNAIMDMYEDVMSGSMLSAAMRKKPKIFPDFFCSMVYVGELSGSLSTVLIKAADFYTNDNKIKQKTRTAMAYPTFISVFVFIIFIVLMVFVVPMFEDIFTENAQYLGDVELNPLSQAIFDISDFLVAYWNYLLIGLIVFGVLVFAFNMTKAGKLTKSWFAIHLPVFRAVTLNKWTTRFSSSFAILVESGMPIVDCLKAIPLIINNTYFTKKFKTAIEQVNNGKTLSQGLQGTGLFPDMLIQMTSVGEQTAALPQTMESISEFYSDQLNASITKATALMEPLTIVMLGVVVGLIIVGVMMPIFSMYSGIAGGTSALS